MIKGKEITKTFDGFVALNKADIHVRKASVYGLVGPNGAGKSTLLRTIAGIYQPDSGQILIGNEPVFENTNAKKRLAFIPDDVFYFRQSNLLDMKKYYKGIYENFDEDLFNRLLENFPELDEKRQIRKMSKGMQKQAAFLLAVSCQPEILLLDEPVDGLDPVMRRQVWSILLTQVKQEELTVLISSHNLKEMEEVCDYVGIMHKGSIIIERSLKELQGNITKLQIAFHGELPDMSENLDIIHTQTLGTVHTLIVRGDPVCVENQARDYHPILVDVLPLTLEEIFIYELGGMNYEVKNIIL